MDRRRTLASIASLVAVVTPLALAARTERIYRLGILWAGSCPPADEVKQWFVLKLLEERGYVDGRNMVVESRCAGADFSQAPRMASELVRLRPDVLFTTGYVATKALHDATKTIPIVANVHDPVASGFARTLSNPGTNVTGRAIWHPDTPAMQVELIRRSIPKLNRLTLIGDIDYPQAREMFRS